MQSTQARRISYLKIGVYIGQVWSVTHPLQVRKREKMASYGIPSRFRLNYRLLQDTGTNYFAVQKTTVPR